MERTYYPLTAAQKMHHHWINRYHTQQVSGVSVVAALQAELDMALLEKCLREEICRYGCMRVRFTRPDKHGEVQQYIMKRDNRKLKTFDLSDLSMEKADEIMQGWAYETFEGDDVPMCEIRLMKLPEGYEGFFIHMDHRLIDSCGLVVMINDVMKLYTHYRFRAPRPEPLADYEEVLRTDLAKASRQKRFLKDKKFWEDQLDTWGEPLYSDIQGPEVLARARKKHNDPTLRAADIEMENLFVQVKDYILEPEPTRRMMDFCQTHQISVTNLLLLGIRTYLSKVNNGQEDITIQNFISSH